MRPLLLGLMAGLAGCFSPCGGGDVEVPPCEDEAVLPNEGVWFIEPDGCDRRDPTCLYEASVEVFGDQVTLTYTDHGGFEQRATYLLQ